MYTMNIRVETAQDLSSVTVPADVDGITVSYPAEYIEGDANNGYDLDTAILIDTIIEYFYGFIFTGSAGIEENGKGEWIKMIRKSD